MKTELLAPAGNLDALKSAVNGGADAVYFGFGNLNARRNAIGFSDEELEFAFSFCHQRGVKVYITLNTEIFEAELEELAGDIKKCERLGADGLIIEDMATYRLAREIAPLMPLHASTQMAVHNVSGARLMKSLGFSRVVLAREMSKKEIKAVCDNVDIETEVFVHGALCYCVSGQCYISSLIGERSGNRGLCAQSCRLPFSVPECSTKNALSLKDLSLTSELLELSKMGVSSLKIEGRMKRPEYVYTVAREGRNALDNKEVDYNALKGIFSRSGFTKGYYEGKIDKNMFGVRSKEDVLESEEIIKSVSSQMTRELPRFSLDMELRVKRGERASLRLNSDGYEAVSYGNEPSEARSKALDRESAIRSLAKLGGTIFKEGSIKTEIDDGLFMSMSEINSLRRNAIDILMEERAKGRETRINSNIWLSLEELEPREETALRLEFSSLEGVPLDMLSLAERVYLPIDECKKAVQNGSIPKEKLWVNLPRVSFGDDRVSLGEKLSDLKEKGVLGAKGSNAGLLYLAKELGFKIAGGFGLNITNSVALNEYKALGLESAVLSFELSLVGARGIKRVIPTGIIAYGYLPAMVTRNCPLRAFRGCKNCNSSNRYITDRKGKDLQISCSGEYVEILNTLPLYMGDKKQGLSSFDFLELCFKNESEGEAREVIKDFIEGSPRENVTRGLYFRKVL